VTVTIPLCALCPLCFFTPTRARPKYIHIHTHRHHTHRDTQHAHAMGGETIGRIGRIGVPLHVTMG